MFVTGGEREKDRQRVTRDEEKGDPREGECRNTGVGGEMACPYLIGERFINI